MDVTSMACMQRDVVGILVIICWENPVQKSCTQKCLLSGYSRSLTEKFLQKESMIVQYIKLSPELVCNIQRTQLLLLH